MTLHETEEYKRFCLAADECSRLVKAEDWVNLVKAAQECLELHRQLEAKHDILHPHYCCGGHLV